MTGVEKFVKRILEENYDLGRILGVASIKAGDTNNSFLAMAEKNGSSQQWYVRQYNRFEEEQDIVYEHALEKYLASRVDDDVQTILPVETKNGSTWVVGEYEDEKNFYTVFNVIHGNEPYSWEFNDLSDNAMKSCAEITAKFHAWCYGFDAPEGSGRHEEPLVGQLQTWMTDFPAALEEKKKRPEIFRRFTDYLEKEVPYLVEMSAFCKGELEKYSDDLVMCINHKDMNPGNVMFDDDDNVNAVFDMDWCNMDYRIYDLVWMGYQAIASWDTDHWGEVPVEKLQSFIDNYNRIMVERECPLGPLNQAETEFLPTMMIIGMLKVLADFICYEDHDHDPYRVFVNSWRFIESVKYMKAYLDQQG